MYALDVLARIRLREGRLADARQLLRGSVQRAKDAGDARHLADAAWHCAELIAAEGRSDSADKLRLLACRECSRLGLMPPAEWAALAPPASDGGAGSREALTSVLDAELAER
jgi:hypothetical protein